MTAVAAVLVSYLVGTIPTGLLVARARGVDIRTVGSGNIGATNVARSLGKKLGALVLVLDALKGFLPALGASWAASDLGWRPEVVAAVGLAAIVGHIFPVWLRFRGGKGVATALGVFMALSPLAALAAVVAYAATVAWSRISSLGSLVATTVLLGGMFATRRPPSVLVLGVAAWLLIVVRHRGNIGRLIRGQEGRF